MKKTTEPTFVDLYRPRHQAVEALSTLMRAKPEERGKALTDFAGTFAATTDTQKTRPSNLLDLYLGKDLRVLMLDLLDRPDHYDERQTMLIGHLGAGQKLDYPISDAEKNELLMTLMRPTTQDVSLRERNRRMAEARRKKEQEEDEFTLLEDGMSVAEARDVENAKQEATATFEKQDFGDKIIL